MKRFKTNQTYVAFMMLILGALFIAGCGNGKDAVLFVDALNNSVTPGTCTKAGPAVTSSNPTDNDVSVSTITAGYPGKLITVTFSEAMKPDTVTTTQFTIRKKSTGAKVDGTVVMTTLTTATFATNAALETNTVYTATITRGAENLAGTSLGCSYKWSFATAAIATIGQAPVNLKTADTYGVFASSAPVTLAVDSLVNGDVGLNPAGACNNCVEGTTVKNGVIENGTPAAIQAQTDFQAAYAEASIRSIGACTLSSPSDISAAQAACLGFTPGPTYRPGLYRTADPIGFTGTITLDALGDSNAVFIFQTNSSLTTASDSKVVLLHQAKAKNVFWIVGSAATLGVSSIFQGTVIANSAAITVLNGVSPSPLTAVEGRLFAGAAVTLDAFATVTVPTP